MIVVIKDFTFGPFGNIDTTETGLDCDSGAVFLPFTALGSYVISMDDSDVHQIQETL